jgi:hypothetical protein
MRQLLMKYFKKLELTADNHITAEDLSLVNVNMVRWIDKLCLADVNQIFAGTIEPNLFCISENIVYNLLWQKLREDLYL